MAGLITGYDYSRALKGKKLGEVLYIPACSLRSEGDLLLDSMSLDELSDALHVKIVPLSNDGAQFLRSLLSEN